MRMGMLTASDISADASFGYSLSMARDCVLVVGATEAAGTLPTSGAVRCEPSFCLSPLHSPTTPAHEACLLSGIRVFASASLRELDSISQTLPNHLADPCK